MFFGCRASREICGRRSKRLSRDAELALKQRIGDDLRLLAIELNKLATYASDATTIEKADVEAIVACNANPTALGLVDALVNAWNAFSGGRAEDDVSIAVIARR